MAAPAAPVGLSILWGCYSQKHNKARKPAPAVPIYGQREYLSYLTVEKSGFLSCHHPNRFEEVVYEILYASIWSLSMPQPKPKPPPQPKPKLLPLLTQPKPKLPPIRRFWQSWLAPGILMTTFLNRLPSMQTSPVSTISWVISTPSPTVCQTVFFL